MTEGSAARLRRRAARTSVRLVVPVGLGLLDRCLRRFGYRRTVRLLGLLSPRPRESRTDLAAARRVGITVNRGARRSGFDRSCLRRSLLAWWLLRWAGLTTEVRFGLAPSTGGGFIAHAWLEHDGVPVNDAANIAEAFPVQHGGDLAAELERTA